jgi:septum formation protein
VQEFEVISGDVSEELEAGPLAAAVARLAEPKARKVAAAYPDAVVLGADTIVVIDGNVLGKPKDQDDAVQMLRRLRGRPHEVLTGVAVIDGPRGLVFTGTEITRVVMARYPDDLIDQYVASGSPFDKAGAYAIQDIDGELVESIAGSYTNVVGLPLGLTARLLVAAGLTVTSLGAS